MSTPSQVLLAICVFLFLTPGADALVCRRCIQFSKARPCFGQACDAAEGEICVGITTYENGKFRDKLLNCEPKDVVPCGVPLPAQIGIHQQISCCDDTDFCNANF